VGSAVGALATSAAAPAAAASAPPPPPAVAIVPAGTLPEGSVAGVPAPIATAASVEAEVDPAVASVGGAPVDAAAAVTGGFVDTVAAVAAVAAAAAVGPPLPSPSLGHGHGTAGGWHGCLPTPVCADAVALAVGVLGRSGWEDGLLSLEEWRVVGWP